MTVSFAAGMNFYKLFWIFLIGGFVGVIIETFWCLLRLRRLESRKGLIYSLFNPVYGFGAVIITVSLSWLEGQRDLWIIICGGIIGGIYEYFCSIIQEKCFKTISWDYKKFPLNFQGRVNLLYCFFWGMLALIWVQNLYPSISALIEKIPNTYGPALTWLCFIWILADSIISACAVYRMSQRHDGIPAASKFWDFIDRHYTDERMQRIYPNMKFSADNISGDNDNDKYTLFNKQKIQSEKIQ